MFDFGFIKSQNRTIGPDLADLKAYYQMVKRG
jgi:hypothetical protein